MRLAWALLRLGGLEIGGRVPLIAMGRDEWGTVGADGARSCGWVHNEDMDQAVDLAQVAAGLAELWSPRVVGRVNDQFLKVVRVKGEFPWHAHAAEDELFLVLKGALTIGRSEADGGPVVVGPGEAFVVPRGVRHNTSAVEETLIALVETVTTEHTGGEQSALTRTVAEQMSGAEFR